MNTRRGLWALIWSMLMTGTAQPSQISDPLNRCRSIVKPPQDEQRKSTEELIVLEIQRLDEGLSCVQTVLASATQGQPVESLLSAMAVLGSDTEATPAVRGNTISEQGIAEALELQTRFSAAKAEAEDDKDFVNSHVGAGLAGVWFRGDQERVGAYKDKEITELLSRSEVAMVAEYHWFSWFDQQRKKALGPFVMARGKWQEGIRLDGAGFGVMLGFADARSAISSVNFGLFVGVDTNVLSWDELNKRALRGHRWTSGILMSITPKLRE